jgi:hypothetical protein
MITPRSFTPTDDEILCRLARSGATAEAIAIEMDRRAEEIKARAHELGIALPD